MSEDTQVKHMRHHMCIDVRGVLEWKSKKNVIALFRRNGKKLSYEEIRNYLYDKLSDGWRVLPMNPENPCEGFDKVEGCPGHEISEEIA